MIVAIALACVAVVLGVRLLIVGTQLRRVDAQLVRRRDENTHHPVSLQLTGSALDDLVVHVNETIAASEAASARTRLHERDLRAIVADMTHDLRTPLTAIRGYQQSLAATSLTDDQRALLAVATRHADELAGLVERLFQYSYLLDSESVLDVRRFDLTALVTDVLLGAVDQLEAAGIDVRLADASPVTLCSDAERVTRIVSNLARNTVQYGTGTVKIGLDPTLDGVRLTWSNPAREAESIDAHRVFDRFYSTSAGTGLGLPIVARLADRLGGTATASLDDGWFTVVVTLANQEP